MSFNKAVKSNLQTIVQAKPDTVNLAGGEAFKLSPEYKLAFGLCSSFLKPEFYRSRDTIINDLIASIKAVSPTFAAKAAIYARTEFGMRSTSHLTAAVLVNQVKGEKWVKEFLNKVIIRVDDATEILAAYLSLFGKPIPNSLKKGLALALSKFTDYQLAKYKSENREVKLVDVFNLVHPKPNEKNANAYAKLINGELASEGTWEADLSKACQGLKTEAEKHKAKLAVWEKLLKTKKLGYFALLRNLRNIYELDSKELIDEAASQLVNKDVIKNSLVLPFRFMTALSELEKLENTANTRTLIKAVSQALELSLANVPTFSGSTLVAIDMSGSMGSRVNAKSNSTAAHMAALFGAVLARANNADILLFDTTVNHAKVRLHESVSSVTQQIYNLFQGGGTNFHLIFTEAKQKYDRIVILSDMQAWDTNGEASFAWHEGTKTNLPATSLAAYCKKYDANPKIYSFDLIGTGTTQFPQKNVFCLAGFSEKVLDIMGQLEKNPTEFIARINNIEL